LVPDHVYKALRVEVLRVDDGGIDVGEDLELARAAHVVTVAGGAVADDPVAVDLLDLAGLVGLDHALGAVGHAADPAVGLDAHAAPGGGCSGEPAIVVAGAAGRSGALATVAAGATAMRR